MQSFIDSQENFDFEDDVNFINRDRAVSFASKIEDRGYLDVNLWDCRIPYGSNAWISDGMEQRTIEDERNGLI